MLEFDEALGLEENLDRFLLAAESTEPELVPILRSVINDLRSANDEGTRRAARARVNEAVRVQLDQLAETSSN